MDSIYKSEISALRSELNQNITAMSNNESFCAGACAALISFAFSKQSAATLSISSLALAVLIYAFGVARFKVMSRHTALLDTYMIEKESQCEDTTGWATWYANNEPSRFPTYNATRNGFWIVLLMVICGAGVALWNPGLLTK